MQQWPKPALQLMLVVIGILTIYAVLGKYVLEPNFPPKPKTQGVEIHYRPLPGVNIADYAVRNANGSFRFNADTPRDLGLAIEFADTRIVNAAIRATFTGESCPEDEIHQLNVSIKGQSVRRQLKLLENETQRITFTLGHGAKLKFNVKNYGNPDCGLVRVDFLEHHLRQAPAHGFVLLWLLMAILCYAIRTSPFIPLLGAAYSALLLQADATLGYLTSGSMIFNSGIGLGLSGGLLLFAAFPFRSRLLSLLATAFVTLCFLLPLLFICYPLLFSEPVNSEVIHAILQSYWQQANEFWGEYAGYPGIIIGLTSIVGIYFCMRQVNRDWPNKLISVATGLLLLVVCSAQFAESVDRSNSFSMIRESVNSYQSEIESFRLIANQRTSQTLQANLDPLFAANTSVIVIGESVNKNHMSSYGYPRDTTPNIDRRLARGEAIRFDNAYSNHTHSDPTMSFLLTQANQYNNREWMTSPSILQMTKSVSLQSAWLSSHRMLGRWSNRITAIANDADRVQTINMNIGMGNTSSTVDGELLPLFREEIDGSPGKLIFLHFYNSHVNYCNRFPDSANRFLGDLDRAYFGEYAEHRNVPLETINCYDNTIYYSDQLLEEIISDLELRSEPAVLLYVADHGDDVFGGRAHNASVYTYVMSDIPLFVWANEAWKAQHPELWANLSANSQGIFTNDLIYETALGLMGISSARVNTRNDLSSHRYAPPPDPTTIHGRKALDDESNWRYWQRVNAGWAKAQGKRIGASDVDSVGKAKLALGLGITIMQVNATVSSQGDLLLTDANGQTSGIDLDSFLAELDVSQLQTLLVSIPGQGAGKAVAGELDRLAARYAIKISRAIPKTGPIALAATNFRDELKRRLRGNGLQLVRIRTDYDKPE